MQVQTENIPKALKQSPNFVLWRKEERDRRETKVPYQRNGRYAKSGDPTTWTNYSAAIAALINGRGKYNGIGFVVSEGTPIGIDLDHCRCPAFPNIEIIAPWATDIIKDVNSYTEASPSGKGIRIFAYGGKLPAHGRKKGLPEYGGDNCREDAVPAFEIYESGRYLTITGNRIAWTPTDVMSRPDAIATVHKRIFSDTATNKGKPEIVQPVVNLSVTDTLKKAYRSKNGEKIRALYNGNYSDYPSQSEADLALCSHLAFWFGNDAAQIDSAFRSSGLFRPKWNEKHFSSGQTYGQSVIEKAIQPNRETYTGKHTAENMPKQESTLDAAIIRLAALSPLKYDQVRKAEAKELGVRPGTLDAAVKFARKGSDANDLPFTEDDPWPDQVDPATLFNEIKTVISRFIVCSKEIAITCSLWITMTWTIGAVDTAPLMVITAPEKRCGKTLLLSLLSRLSYRAITASSISPAALFRTIEAWTPTLFIDEADACLKDNEELRGILNSGHTRDSAYVIRTVGDEFKPTKFRTFGAKAIAGIGQIADTLMDRAVVMELRRKTSGEKVDRIRNADPALFDKLRSKLARFAEDNSQFVRQAQPPLPDKLNDRSQDNWHPLLALAMSAGDKWLQNGTEAALKLSGNENEPQTIGTELLSDIQKVFKEKKVDHISTADIINSLCTDDERPWKSYSKGFSITPRQLANKLKTYGIHSKTVRIGDDTAKGFEKDQFAEAFSRYISSTAISCVTTSQVSNNNNLGQYSSVTRCDDVTDKKLPKAAPVKDCDVVTDRKHLDREEKIFATDIESFDFTDAEIEVVQ